MITPNVNIVYFDATPEKVCVAFELERKFTINSVDEVVTTTGLPQPRSHNQAEYIALIDALLSVAHPHLETIVRGDSQLVINQMKGSYAVRSREIEPYYRYAKNLLKLFDNIRFEFVPREENIAGQILEGKVPTGFEIDRSVYEHCLKESYSYYISQVGSCAIRVIAERLVRVES